MTRTFGFAPAFYWAFAAFSAPIKHKAPIANEAVIA
jgi:hypothetical protein